jgi:hypothetical protein
LNKTKRFEIDDFGILSLACPPTGVAVLSEEWVPPLSDTSIGGAVSGQVAVESFTLA